MNPKDDEGLVLGSICHGGWGACPCATDPLTLPSPLTFQENPECRVFQALQVHQALQVPRVRQDTLVPLGQEVRSFIPALGMVSQHLFIPILTPMWCVSSRTHRDCWESRACRSERKQGRHR